MFNPQPSTRSQPHHKEVWATLGLPADQTLEHVRKSDTHVAAIADLGVDD